MTIKPCPFCGSNNIEYDFGGVVESYGHDYQSVWIECLECNARMDGETRDGIEINSPILKKWSQQPLS